MSIIETLVTDRTQADVDSRNEKGTYNAADLNRVQSAMEYIAGCLQDYGYPVVLQELPAWADNDIPTEAQMAAYLNNLSTLRSAISALQTTPEAPDSMALLTWVGANNIEQILIDLDTVLTDIRQSYLCAGLPWGYAESEIYVRIEG